VGAARLTPDPDRVRRLRARAQRLDRAADATPHDLARRLAGIPAQHPPAIPLVLRARTRAGTEHDVERATRDRSVIRTWAMRGTLHLLAADDAGWMVGLLGPIAAAADAPRRRRLGLDDDATHRGKTLLAAVLAQRGPSTRVELVEALAARGLAMDPKSQAPIHLIHYAACHGVLCLGPDRDRESTYVRTADWIGEARPVDEERGLAELARRYLGAFGPAGAADLAAWAGIGLMRARRALRLIADELAPAGDGGWLPRGVAADAPPAPTRLRPLFDPYLLGYASRDLVLDPAHGAAVRRGGGFIRPTLLHEGRIVATWRHERRAAEIRVTITPFAPLPEVVWADVEREAADVGRHLGLRGVLTTPAAT
jgi:hypothetical protein